MCKNKNHLVAFCGIIYGKEGVYSEIEFFNIIKDLIDYKYRQYIYPTDCDILENNMHGFNFDNKNYLEDCNNYIFFEFCPVCGEKLELNKLYKRINKKIEEYILTLQPRTIEQTAKIIKRRKKLKTEGIQRTKDERFVYLVKMRENYKIGISKNPEKRFGEFTLLPEKLETIFIHKVANAKLVESDLHEIFNNKRVRGEWFNLTKEDIEFVKRYINESKIEKTMKGE